MARVFALSAKNFRTELENGGKNRKYSRDVNFGEYIRFMSGAAGKDLRPLVENAFDVSAESEAQWAKARSEFPNGTYP